VLKFAVCTSTDEQLTRQTWCRAWIEKGTVLLIVLCVPWTMRIKWTHCQRECLSSRFICASTRRISTNFGIGFWYL